MRTVASAIFGVIFGLGLLISGMLDPANVIGFLDVAGDWDPRLAFVMGGAIAAAAPAFVLARRRGRTLLNEPLTLPSRWNIDRRLVIGAAIFGLGWGLAGICPGPSVVLAGFAGPPAWAFLAASVTGAVGARCLIERRQAA